VPRGEHPFHLDSKRPSIPLSAFAQEEARYAMLSRTDPVRAAELGRLAQNDVDARWLLYEQLAEVDRGRPEDDPAEVADPGGREEVDP